MLSRECSQIVEAGRGQSEGEEYTVYSSPVWIVSEVAGQEIFHSDAGKSVEVCRKDVVKFFSGLQTIATRSSKPRSRSALRNNIDSAIADIWADEKISIRPKDRDNKIHEWLRSHGIIARSEDVTRTIQRVLAETRKGHRKATSD